jgi:hypothetical protein
VDIQNLAYALTQVVHNFGAVATVGGAAVAHMPGRTGSRDRRRFARLVLVGWAAQAASGVAFGTISYASYGQLPDIHGIALAALGLKMACAATGLVLTATYLRCEDRWTERGRDAAWLLLVALAATALTAAAFLRWFS